MNFSFAEVALAIGMTTNAQVDVDHIQLLCLAKNVYYEARGESTAGQLAVAHLTLNRAASNRFPNTVCDVVKEDRGRKARDCQFSWYCDGKSDTPGDAEAFQKAMLISIDAMTGKNPNPVIGATHFYAYKSVQPNWANMFTEIAVINNHRFMQE